MIIRVRDSKGKVFSSEYIKGEFEGIVSIHFGDSYTQVEVQEENEEGRKTKNICIPNSKNSMSWIDMIPFKDDEYGEWA